jgi:L,D-transpeptidase-like protein
MLVLCRRIGLVLLLGALLVGPGAVFAADGPAQWAVPMVTTHLYSGPGEDTTDFGALKAYTPLQILGYSGDWAYVREPRGGGSAWIRTDVLGESDAPSPYLTKPAPPIEEPLGLRGILTASTPLSLYPTAADEAVESRLSSNTWLTLESSVRGENGELWYRTPDGDYVPSGSVFLPDRPEVFAGHWLDVNLATPARVTAYDGDTPVRSFLTIKGAGPRPTPTGTFTILRRVANETMNSDTIGIPRFGPGGYYLTGVLFTQYFTGDGASLHYNYWSSNWGYPGSHGCLGLTYNDSAWLWDFATIGTPVDIHY